MIHLTLLKREAKANYKLLLIFCGVLTLYMSMITSMFDPALGESLNAMMESMPELFAAFGMASPGATLLDFLINYLYGFLLVIFPMIFMLILSGRLVARYVDQGSMAWLLATPNSRLKIALTQAVSAALGSLILTVYVVGAELGLSAAMFPGKLDTGRFLLVNLGLYGLLFFLGGLCFCASCLFNDARRAIGVSAGFCIAFVLVQMISQAGEKFDFLQYATPLTLFNPEGLAAGEPGAVYTALILYGVGLLLFASGIAAFCKRDLPL